MVSISNVSATVASTVRNVSFTHNAQSSDFFAKSWAKTSSPWAAARSLNNATAPNTNFYIFLTSSPSIAIAMLANTSKQGGCAFACH